MPQERFVRRLVWLFTDGAISIQTNRSFVVGLSSVPGQRADVSQVGEGDIV